jgi:hypothetical protein
VHPVFGRSQHHASDEPSPTTPIKVGGKGAPTPKRREAEAAAKAKAKVPRTRKELSAARRSARASSSARMREAMKTGEERYLPARDQGVVRRFIRDFVDSRLSFLDLLLPIMLVSLALGWSGDVRLRAFSNYLVVSTLILVVVEVVRLRFRLRRELGRRFPDESTKGTTYYAAMRSLQLKPLRMPRAQVKIGQQLPDHYR